MYARDIDVSFYKSPSKVKLVAPNPSFAPITIKWIGQNDVTQYLGADFSGMTEEDEVAHLKSMIEDDDRFSWMIERDGEIVGNVEINEIKELSEKYKVKAGAFCTLIGDPRNWGKGLGQTAKQAACNWAFNEGGFDLIEAKAYKQNTRSWSVLEKLGYEFIGIENDEVAGSSVEWKAYKLTKDRWKTLDWAQF